MRSFLTFAVLAGLVVMVPLAQAVVIEDFEDNDISDWTSFGTTNVQTTAAAAHDGNYGMAYYGIGGNEGWIYRNDAGVTVSQGDVIGMWTQTIPDVSLNTRNYCGFGSSGSGTYSAVIAPNTANLIIQLDVGFGYNSLAETAYGNWLGSHWYYLEVEWNVGGGINVSCFDEDGTTLLVGVATTNGTYTTGGIAFRSFGSIGMYASYDTVTRGGGATAVEPATWGGIKSSFR